VKNSSHNLLVHNLLVHRLWLLIAAVALSVAVPAAAQPGAAKTGAAKSNTAKPEAAKPEAAKPTSAGKSDEPLSPLLLGSAALNALLLLGLVGLLAKRRSTPQATPEYSGGTAISPLFDSAEVGVASLDAEGRVVEANGAFQRIFGFNEQELRGKNFSNLVHPDDVLQDRRLYTEVVEGDRPGYQLEQRYFDKRGQELWARVSVARTKGGAALATATVQDVTRRQVAEDELKVTREALHNLYQVVVGPDLELSEKMHALLSMGCRRFGLETGVVGKIRDNQLEVIQVVSPDERLRRGKIYEVSPATQPRTGDEPAAESLPPGQTIQPAPHGLQRSGVLHDWQQYPFFSVTEGETYFGAPIIVFGDLFGTVNFTSPEPRRKPFEAGETELLQLMAQWLGNEMERIQARADLETKQSELMEANAKLESLATHDGLTGVKNRRAFDERLAMEFQRSRRYSTPLSLLLLDVDKFKQFNDTFGHPAGDRVLQQVAKVLQASVRNIDFVARYGGEEFVVLLPNTDRDGAMILAERLRANIEAAPWKERPVTASFGAATLTSEMAEYSVLTSTADGALYQSKEKGRNRVTHAADVEPETPAGFSLKPEA